MTQCIARIIEAPSGITVYLSDSLGFPTGYSLGEYKINLESIDKAKEWAKQAAKDKGLDLIGWLIVGDRVPARLPNPVKATEFIGAKAWDSENMQLHKEQKSDRIERSREILSQMTKNF